MARRPVRDDYPNEQILFESIIEGKNARLFYNRIPELAASVASQGLIEPPVVRKIDGGKHELVAGFRRKRAIELIRQEILVDDPAPEQETLLKRLPEGDHKRLLGPKRFQKIRVCIFEGSDLDALCLNITENGERKNLGVYELGCAFQTIRKEHDLSGNDIGERLGYSKSHVNNCLRVVENGCDELLHALQANAEGRLSTIFTSRRIFRIAGIKDKSKQQDEVKRLWDEDKTTTPDDDWLREPKKSKRLLSFQKAAVLLVNLEQRAREDPATWQMAVATLRFAMNLGPNPLKNN